MAITRKDVEYVSRLARIRMSDEELEGFTVQLDKILEYMTKLCELDTENIKPTSRVLDLANVDRADTLPAESLEHEKAVRMAPEKEGRFFKVPRVIE